MMLRIDRKADVLAGIYHEAESRLRALVDRALVSGALGTARYRRAQLVEVRNILAGLDREALPQADDLIAGAYTLGVAIPDSSVSGQFSGVHQDAIDVLAQSLRTKLNGASQTVGRQIQDLFRREGLREVAIGVAAGAARREISAALAESLRREGAIAFVDRSNRSWGLESYAKMVARTTTREAVSHGTVNRMLESGLDLVSISSHKHEPDICDRYDGKTFSLTAKLGYEQLEQFPPFHPNCRHVLAPAQTDFAKLQSQVENASSIKELERVLTSGGQGGRPPSPPPPTQQPAPGESPFQVSSDLWEEPAAVAESVGAAAATVHDLPEEARGLPVVRMPRQGFRPTDKAAYAYPASRPRDGFIALRRQSSPLMVAHEFGHVLDHRVFGEFDRLASANLPHGAMVRDPRFADVPQRYRRWWEAIVGSDHFERLGGLGLPPRFLSYMRSSDECWARAYAQWLTLRSGDEGLLADLRSAQGGDNPRIRDYYQWSDDDFEPIAEAMDEIFQEAGLVR